jgi:phenylacetate-CoA ligase
MKPALDSLLHALERRLIRRMMRRAHPEALMRKGRKWLLPAFRRAAARSPAYRALLAEAGVDPASIRSVEDFVARCPILDKTNTFRRFPVEQLLCDDIKPEDLASIITSSGHGGNGFAFGISSWQQLRGAARLIDIGLDMAFDVGSRRTLLVNCLPMGVTFQSNLVCVANVSVREDMACAIIDRAGSLFEQIVLCGDPLFLKKLCDYSQDIGLDWKRFRVHVIVGEETFPETFRDYLAGVLGNDPNDPASSLIGSSMGVGELGLNLFNETRETVALRRACISNPTLLENLTGINGAVSPAPTFMVFNPLRTLVEVVNQDGDGIGDLVVTVMDEQAPVPLMRYATGDRMQLLAGKRIAAVADQLPPGMALPTAPVVALHGRDKDRLPGGGHVDLFKTALYRQPEVARHLSGAHRISMESGGIRWEVQAGCRATENLACLAERLHAQLMPALPGRSLSVVVLGYDDFPYGRTIDYERKFAYWSPALPA